MAYNETTDPKLHKARSCISGAPIGRRDCPRGTFLPPAPPLGGGAILGLSGGGFLRQRCQRVRSAVIARAFAAAVARSFGGEACGREVGASFPSLRFLWLFMCDSGKIGFLLGGKKGAKGSEAERSFALKQTFAGEGVEITCGCGKGRGWESSLAWMMG